MPTLATTIKLLCTVLIMDSYHAKWSTRNILSEQLLRWPVALGAGNR